MRHERYIREAQDAPRVVELAPVGKFVWQVHLWLLDAVEYGDTQPQEAEVGLLVVVSAHRMLWLHQRPPAAEVLVPALSANLIEADLDR